MNLGSVAVGKSGTQTLNVKNCGNAPLNLTSVVSSDPTVVPTQSCTAVAAGSVCPITLTFTPVANSTVDGTLTIVDNAVLPPPVVSLSGTGQAPQITTIPTAVVFPAQVLGANASGAPVSVLVKNTGTSPLNIQPSSTTTTGDFSIASDGCTFAINPNAFCLINVSFTPTQSGTRTGTLSIASNDPANPTLAVPLSGTALTAYPVATISELINPSYAVTSGSSAVSVMVEGSNFFPSSVVYANGAAQTTAYQSSTTLSFNLNPTLLHTMSEISITVVNPTPGGGASASYPLLAYLSLPMVASSLVVDPVGGLLYAASPANATNNANTVIPINPATGVTKTPIAVSRDPQVLAVSDDGSELYVATSAGVLQRINLSTLAIEKTFNLPVDTEWGQTYAHEMHVVPGSPKSIVVALFANVDPQEDGAALYNDSGLVNWIPGEAPNKNPLILDSFTFTSPTTFYGLPQGNTFFSEVQLTSNGLRLISPGGSGCCNQTTGSLLASDGTSIYTNSGEVWNPTTQALLGTYLEQGGSQPFYAGRPVPDNANGHTYILDDAQYQDMTSLNIDVYDQSSFALVSSIPFVGTNFTSTTSDLARWGTNGLAFRSYDLTGTSPNADQIILLTSSKVTATGAPPFPSCPRSPPHPCMWVGPHTQSR